MRRPNLSDAVSKMSCNENAVSMVELQNLKEVGPMKKYSSSTKKMTIGLDVGDQHSYYVLLDGEAEVIEEGQIRTRQEAFGKK